MLEARIISPRGSLYIAAEATPYDVQQLRSHIHALCTQNASDVHLTLRLGPNSRARIGELVMALAANLADEGICVSIQDERGAREDVARGLPFVSTRKRRARRTARRVRSCVA